MTQAIDTTLTEGATVDSNGAAVDSNGETVKADTAKTPVKEDVNAMIENADMPTTKTGLMSAFKAIEGITEEDIKEFKGLAFEAAKSVYKEAKSGKKMQDIMSSYREEDQPEPVTIGDPFTTKVKVAESLGNIFAGEDLTEDFKVKAETLFESVITARVNEEVAIIEEESKKEIESRISELKESMTAQLDKYLTHVVSEWVEENRLAVETGLKAEIAEDFIVGLKTLFVEHSMNIPAEDESILEETLKEKTELEEEVNNLLSTTSTLKEQVISYQKKEVLSTISEGLADTQVEKFEKLVETVEFKDATQYAEQVAIIKEHYFPKTKLVEEVAAEIAADVKPEASKVARPAYIEEAAKFIGNQTR